MKKPYILIRSGIITKDKYLKLDIESGLLIPTNTPYMFKNYEAARSAIRKTDRFKKKIDKIKLHRAIEINKQSKYHDSKEYIELNKKASKLHIDKFNKNDVILQKIEVPKNQFYMTDAAETQIIHILDYIEEILNLSTTGLLKYDMYLLYSINNLDMHISYHEYIMGKLVEHYLHSGMHQDDFDDEDLLAINFIYTYIQGGHTKLAGYFNPYNISLLRKIFVKRIGLVTLSDYRLYKKNYYKQLNKKYYKSFWKSLKDVIYEAMTFSLHEWYPENFGEPSNKTEGVNEKKSN